MFARDKAGGRAGAVFLSAFGKHPGWDDHIEDIGIETDGLAALKQLLYVQGIGGTIDSGSWDSLTDAQRTEGFRHVFVCRTGADVVVGRLWSSTDGKGRARYPMVVCVQCSGLPLRWAVETLLPRLEALQERCTAVGTAGDVIAITDQAREEYRNLAAEADVGGSGFVVSARTLARLAEHPEMGENHEGVLRILYQIEREMSPYLRGSYAAAVRDGELRPIQMRVPACGQSPEEIILQWFDFMYGQLDPGAEVWAIVPLDRPWVDIFVGEPFPQQFFCFQASREALPLASEIPYTLDEEFIDRSEKLIEASREGTAQQVVVKAEAPPARRRTLRETLDVAALASFWRNKSVRLAAIVILIGAVLLALLVGAMALWPEKRKEVPPPETPRGPVMSPADARTWEALCGTFYEWFGSFLADVDRGRLERWARDQHLRKHVVPILREVQGGQRRLDPRQLANVVGNLQFMRRTPPASAKSPEVIARTRDALATVRDLERNLSRDWVTLKRLEDLAGQYKARGWLGASQYLASVAGEVRVGADLAGRVDRAVDVAVRAEKLEASWDEVQKQAERLAASGSPLLAKFGEYATIETSLAPRAGTVGTVGHLAATASRLADIRDLAAPLVAYVEGDWESRIDMEMVRRHRPVDVPTDPNALRGGGIFRKWHAAIQGERYRKLDPAGDPRKRGDWTAGQQTVLASIGRKIRELETKHGYKKTAELSAGLQALRDELADLGKIRWDQDHKIEIARRVRAFQAKPPPLVKAVGTVLAKVIGGRKAYLASIPPTISQSAEINRYWQGRLKELEKITDLGQLTAKVQKLEEDLARLDGELAATLGAEPGDVDWNRKLATDVLAARRDRALAAALGALAWRNGEIVRSAEFEARWKKLRGDFDAWRGDVGKLMAAFNAIDAALDLGAGPDEKPKAFDETLAGLYARWRGQPIGKDPAVRAAVKPVTDRLDQLIATTRLTDAEPLADAAGRAVKGRFEAARAAWRRLAQLPAPWPDSPDEFTRERRLHRNLMDVYALVEDPVRKKQLQDELTAESRRRWEAYFSGRTDAAEIRAAIRRMGDFYLDRADPAGLKPIHQFRLGLYDLRRKILRSQPGDDEMKKAIADFLAGVARLPGSVGAKPPVSDFVAQLRRVAVAKKGGADLGKAGPALANWRAHDFADGTSVRYTWTSSSGERHALRFVRIEPAGQRASFLCTTEVPVGLFIDVIVSKARWPEFRKLLKTYDGPESDPRYGPRTWELARSGERRIVDAVSWCRTPVGLPVSEFYPKELKVGSPERTHPVQYVSPQAAAYFARLLGCRLPASAEWTEAWKSHGGPDKAHPPNLRDKAWAKQRDRIRHFEESGKYGNIDSYYPDAGIFWPKGFAGIVEGRNAKAADSDDGVLWFSGVDSGGGATFHHLVGNVAELTFEDPAALAKVPASAGEVAKLLGSASGRLRVIGGSAMSSPALKVETAYPLDYAVASEGYSDVGFRLAFTAPAESVGVRLRRLLKESGYLTQPAK